MHCGHPRHKEREGDRRTICQVLNEPGAGDMCGDRQSPHPADTMVPTASTHSKKQECQQVAAVALEAVEQEQQQEQAAAAETAALEAATVAAVQQR